MKKTDSLIVLNQNFDASIWMRTCEQQVTEPLVAYKISGEIPHWLNGALVRNGPGRFHWGRDLYRHWFDGSALLQRFEIRSDNNVTYQSRFIETEAFRRNSRCGRIVQNDFGTVAAVRDPQCALFEHIYAHYFTLNMSDNSVITVQQLRTNGELWALGETPRVHRIDAQTLETAAHATIPQILSQTSHPHSRPDGFYNVGLKWDLTGLKYAIFRCDASMSNMQIVANVAPQSSWNPSYMHSFGITQNWYILIEQPLVISVMAHLKCKLKTAPLVDSLRQRNAPTEISLINRKTGTVFQWKYSADTFFYFHTINQYEINEDYVVLDVCTYKDISIIKCFYLDSLKACHENSEFSRGFQAVPHRFVMPLNPKKTTANLLENLPNCTAEAYLRSPGKIHLIPEKLCNLYCEMPTINYDKYCGQFYRYFYANTMDLEGNTPGMIIKVDTVTKCVIVWKEYNCYPSEPIFVEKPNAQEEDDGIVLASLLWSTPNRENFVSLLILDGKTLTELSRIEFESQTAVPKCLHGKFLLNESIE